MINITKSRLVTIFTNKIISIFYWVAFKRVKWNIQVIFKMIACSGELPVSEFLKHCVYEGAKNSFQRGCLYWGVAFIRVAYSGVRLYFLFGKKKCKYTRMQVEIRNLRIDAQGAKCIVAKCIVASCIVTKCKGRIDWGRSEKGRNGCKPKVKQWYFH